VFVTTIAYPDSTQGEIVNRNSNGALGRQLPMGGRGGERDTKAHDYRQKPSGEFWLH
jgi:hypothetical protein